MDEYEVIVTPDAENELNELDDYITFELLAPDTAVAYVAFIKSELASLSHMPNRYRLVDDEPWHSRGVRRMNAKNFAVFYIVLEDYHEVYIQNVIYQKRSIPQVLHDFSNFGNYKDCQPDYDDDRRTDPDRTQAPEP